MLDQPMNPFLWTGRSDPEEGAGGVRWHEVIEAFGPGADRGTVLLGFACDEGVKRNKGRAGAAKGPTATRQALAGKAWHPAPPVYDAGDVVCLDGDLAAAQDRLADGLAIVLGAGHQAIVMGGGHEIAFGSFSGLARHLQGSADAPRIGVLNLDAHFDLRNCDEVQSSGTPFLQIAHDCAARDWPFHYMVLGIARDANTQALYDRAGMLGTQFVEDHEMSPWNREDVLEKVRDFLDTVDHLYLTFCLDVLPAGVAPGVSAPSARGIELSMAEAVVREVLAHAPHKLRVADIAELNPSLDIDSRTAKVAARLVHLLAGTEWRTP